MTTSVLVLGAGFGGLETCARLTELLGAAVEVTLIDKGAGFVFGYSKLDVMFGRERADAVRHSYTAVRMQGVEVVQETIVAIDPVARTATTDRATYRGDILVVALGADYDIDATPGLSTLGHEFYSVGGAFGLRRTLDEFQGGDVVIGVCGPGYKCPPAPHECTLLLHDELTRRGIRDRGSITVVSPLPVPLPPSPELSQAILARYAERGIEFIGGHRVTSLEEAGGGREAVLQDGRRLPYDLFLGIPVHRVPAVVAASGLAENGWIPVDKGSAATRFPGVYAVGDVTSVGTPKAGVFAEGAARAMADRIAAGIRGEAEPAGYDGTGACYVELGQGAVGHIRVDFFSDPDRPHGWFSGPTPEAVSGKADFGASRRARWFAAAR